MKRRNSMTITLVLAACAAIFGYFYVEDMLEQRRKNRPLTLEERMGEIHRGRVDEARIRFLRIVDPEFVEMLEEAYPR